MLGFFSLVSILSLWKIKESQSHFWRGAYVFSTITSLYLLNTAFLLLILHNVLFLVLHHRCLEISQRRLWLFLQFCVLGAFMFWGPQIFNQIGALQKGEWLGWIQVPTLGHIAEMLMEFCGAFPVH
ncbi:MAG: hypothetical protein AABZ32_04420, partial [Bacteroidota bacterium]